MRLPDGDTTGGGFSSTGFQSLAKLRDGNISSMNTVDGSATYTSWPDLYRTVGAIVTAFAPYDATTKINAPDFNRTMQSFEGKNCNGCADHSDHLAVADALYAIAVTGGAPWSRKWYIDYPICWADSRYPVNLDSAGYQLKKALFMAYNNRFKEMTGIDTYAQQTSFLGETASRAVFEDCVISDAIDGWRPATPSVPTPVRARPGIGITASPNRAPVQGPQPRGC